MKWKMDSMFLPLVLFVIGVSVAPGAIFKLDVNDKDSNSAAETEAGFTPIVMGSDNQTAIATVGGVTVTILSDTKETNERRRATPTGIPYEQIYRDFIFGRAAGLKVTLTGLQANAVYKLTMYSFDSGSTANPPREAIWTSNGSYLFTTSFNGTVLPTGADDYAHTGLVTADGTGQITLQSAKGPNTPAAESLFSFINALILEYPAGANTPFPADGAAGVEDTGTVTLHWNTGLVDDPENPGLAIVNPDITTHYLYMNNGSLNDPNMSLVATIPASGPTGSYDISNIGLDRVFYWSVEEGVKSAAPGEPNNIPGATWSFSSKVSMPVILDQPTDQAVFPGETASIEVDASSITPMTYSWYKSDDDVIDTSDSLLLSGVGANPLLLNVNSDTSLAVQNNQGYYYCILNNGIQVATDVVFLTVKRPIAHFAFDQTAVDSSIHANNGIWIDSSLEVYSEGIIGSGAAVFAGVDPNSYINIGLNAAPSADPKIGGVLEGSAVYWIKTTSTNFMNICGTFNNADNSGFQLNLNEGSFGTVRAYVRGGATTNVAVTLADATTVLFDGQWHHLAFTWSTSANQGIIYLDGQVVATQIVASPQLTPWEYPMTIGARNVRGVVGGFLVGGLDELRIYNYALPKEEVYDLFLAGPSDWVCDVYPEYDWDRNCVVDLGDFAVFAAKWLDCGKYPVTICP